VLAKNKIKFYKTSSSSTRTSCLKIKKKKIKKKKLKKKIEKKKLLPAAITLAVAKRSRI